MTAEGLKSRIYFGRVMHKRLRPFAHRFDYRVYAFLFDLDELGRLDRELPGFSHNRGNLFSLRDRDHGPRDGSPLKPWAEAVCARGGIDLKGGRIELLCLPRLLGYAFNPLSLWFCHDRAGSLQAVIYEVRNTFGERHSYVLPKSESSGVLRHGCAKNFYVSPFMSMEADYQFRVAPPSETISVAIRQSSGGRPHMNAAFVGERRPLTSGNLASAIARNPMMTLKVMGGIHWEALKLWRKGLTFHRRPSPPAQPFTVIHQDLRHQEK